MQPWMRPYLTGKCFDFALALAELIEHPVFVAVGSPKFPDHVALRIGDRYADVRGILEEPEFLAHHVGKPITEIDREAVELHCGAAGMLPPYDDLEDIAEVRDAVDRALLENAGMEDAISESREIPNPS
jgi:hypothetical protein